MKYNIKYVRVLYTNIIKRVIFAKSETVKSNDLFYRLVVFLQDNYSSTLYLSEACIKFAQKGCFASALQSLDYPRNHQTSRQWKSIW